MAQTLISWQAPEFEYRHKTADWYWAVWIIVISIAVISVLFSDILLAILVIIGAFAVTVLSNKAPRLIQYELTTSGLRIGDTLYQYDTLQSYNIEEIEGVRPKLLIKSRKLFMPLIAIPLIGVHPDDIYEILEKYLMKESELHEPLLQKIIEFLGF